MLIDQICPVFDDAVAPSILDLLATLVNADGFVEGYGDIRQPTLFEMDHEGQMAKLHSKSPSLISHPGREPVDLVSQGLQQRSKSPVQLEAKTSPALFHDLIEKTLSVDIDPPSGWDIQVLERHCFNMGLVQGS